MPHKPAKATDTDESESESVDEDGFDWSEVASVLPLGKDEEQAKARRQLWSAFDVNGNGYVSFSETNMGLRKVVRQELIVAAKPAIKGAFEFAKDYSKARVGNKYGDDFIEKKEFEAFLITLAQRLEYWHVFRRAESQGDGRIDLKEFLGARKTIEKWIGRMVDPEQEFQNLDANGGGQVLFREFCDWSFRRHLEWLEAGASPAVEPEAALPIDEEQEEPPTREIINPYAQSEAVGSFALADQGTMAKNTEGKDGPKQPMPKQLVGHNLQSNLVNLQDRKNFKKKHLSIFEVSDGILANKLLNGEKLILSRLIGHPELEPIRAPLFTRR